MNDKPTTDDAKAFDPAAHGWKIVNNTPFGDLVGPIWKHETPERLRPSRSAMASWVRPKASDRRA